MAWTAPRTWDETVVTADIFNTHVRDNFLSLENHTHSGALGDGSNLLDIGQTFTGQTDMSLASNAAEMSTEGELRRVGSNLRYFGGLGVVQLSPDAVASMPSSRTLGTGSDQAAAGNHTHP